MSNSNLWSFQKNIFHDYICLLKMTNNTNKTYDFRIGFNCHLKVFKLVSKYELFIFISDKRSVYILNKIENYRFVADWFKIKLTRDLIINKKNNWTNKIYVFLIKQFIFDLLIIIEWELCELVETKGSIMTIWILKII